MTGSKKTTSAKKNATFPLGPDEGGTHPTRHNDTEPTEEVRTNRTRIPGSRLQVEVRQSNLTNPLLSLRLLEERGEETVTGRGAHRPGGLVGHRDEAEPRSNHALEELGVLRPLSRDGRPQVTVRARRNPALVRHAGDSVIEARLQGKPSIIQHHCPTDNYT